MKISDLLPFWKAEALRDARMRAKRGRQAFDRMTDKTTTYAIAIRTMAEIHEQALAVYETACTAPPPSRDELGAAIAAMVPTGGELVCARCGAPWGHRHSETCINVPAPVAGKESSP